MPTRCQWATSDLMVDYHDREWGAPLHDDKKLFELLMLEGAQAGLSWEIVLRKRESYREAFDHFDARKMAGYGQDRIAELLQNPGIVRNRLKVAAFVQNAGAYLDIQNRFGSFDAYLWSFVDGHPVRNSWRDLSEVPVKTDLSERLSADLKRSGFKFVGSTICYAFLQAAGLVNDHVITCFRYLELGGPGVPSAQ
ncbi:MAG: DNA-3-methyladenine glycosylase I [Chloroflexi bacterium]|nr:DNA-3-methyladenine glycosylase I [Chloroflexota bacterium]MCI0786175.1 DNA-3-methyladenine glycosylase I [Chloroflexota bacterium]MCI0824939.1 DNA-3-methyladenine glycosylase I [Chloroflexota bacterium]MCI0867171.1 DNA-3-methyladenine glycosylase I [Chloroflexota bacterium]